MRLSIKAKLAGTYIFIFALFGASVVMALRDLRAADQELQDIMRLEVTELGVINEIAGLDRCRRFPDRPARCAG